jgi:hypothetical protein
MEGGEWIDGWMIPLGDGWGAIVTADGIVSRLNTHGSCKIISRHIPETDEHFVLTRRTIHAWGFAREAYRYHRYMQNDPLPPSDQHGMNCPESSMAGTATASSHPSGPWTLTGHESFTDPMHCYPT